MGYVTWKTAAESSRFSMWGPRLRREPTAKGVGCQSRQQECRCRSTKSKDAEGSRSADAKTAGAKQSESRDEMSGSTKLGCRSRSEMLNAAVSSAAKLRFRRKRYEVLETAVKGTGIKRRVINSRSIVQALKVMDIRCCGGDAGRHMPGSF